VVDLDAVNFKARPSFADGLVAITPSSNGGIQHRT
jgi:hypothetical protein